MSFDSSSSSSSSKGSTRKRSSRSSERRAVNSDTDGQLSDKQAAMVKDIKDTPKEPLGDIKDDENSSISNPTNTGAATSTEHAEARFSSTLRWLQLCVFLDFFGVSLVVPLLPSYFRAAGLDGEAVGLISSLYYLSQVVGGAAIGVLSDMLPRRDVLLLSFLGSALSYYIVGHAPTLWLLFASRAVVGLVKHTMTIGSALVTEGGREESRAANIGRLHAYSTLAFIVGPSIGSLLYKQHPSYPCLASSALFLANAALCYCVIPRHSGVKKAHSDEDIYKDDIDVAVKADRSSSIGKWFRQFSSSISSLRDNGILTHMCGILSIVFVDRAMSINNMLSYLEIRYNIPAYQIGFVASATSVFGFLAQYVLVDRAIKICGSERHAIIYCLFCMALVTYGEYYCESIYHYVYFIVPVTTICSNIILTCNRSSISKLVSSDHMGKLLGALNVLDAVAGVAAPVYGAELFSRSGYRGRAPVVSVHYFLLATFISMIFSK